MCVNNFPRVALYLGIQKVIGLDSDDGDGSLV